MPRREEPPEFRMERYHIHFSNGYGASVIRGKYSYGGDLGLWELGALKENENGEWGFIYIPGITGGDVLGHLSEERVEEVLDMIKALPVTFNPQFGGIKWL